MEVAIGHLAVVVTVDVVVEGEKRGGAKQVAPCRRSKKIAVLARMYIVFRLECKPRGDCSFGDWKGIFTLEDPQHSRSKIFGSVESVEYSKSRYRDVDEDAVDCCSFGDDAMRCDGFLCGAVQGSRFKRRLD